LEHDVFPSENKHDPSVESQAIPAFVVTSDREWITVERKTIRLDNDPGSEVDEIDTGYSAKLVEYRALWLWKWKLRL
jgi:hypothetical protein